MAATVRRAAERDARAIAGIHVRAWHAAYRRLVPDQVLERFTVERWERTWQGILGDKGGRTFTLIAEADDRAVGFCAVSTPSRDEDAGEGTAEIAATYVEPDLWRKGLGGSLMDAALDELRRGEWQEVTLWVFAANDRAQAFYRRFGFTGDGSQMKHEPTGQVAVRMRAELTREHRAAGFLTERGSHGRGLDHERDGGQHRERATPATYRASRSAVRFRSVPGGAHAARGPAGAGSRTVPATVTGNRPEQASHGSRGRRPLCAR